MSNSSDGALKRQVLFNELVPRKSQQLSHDNLLPPSIASKLRQLPSDVNRYGIFSDISIENNIKNKGNIIKKDTETDNSVNGNHNSDIIDKQNGKIVISNYNLTNQKNCIKDRTLKLNIRHGNLYTEYRTPWDLRSLTNREFTSRSSTLNHYSDKYLLGPSEENEYDELVPIKETAVSVEDQMSVKELVSKYNAIIKNKYMSENDDENDIYKHINQPGFENNYETMPYLPSSYLFYKRESENQLPEMTSGTSSMYRPEQPLPFTEELKAAAPMDAFEARLSEFDKDFWYARIQKKRQRQAKKRLRKRSWKGFRRKMSSMCFAVCPTGEEILLKFAPQESRAEFRGIFAKSLVGTYTQTPFNSVFDSVWNSNIFQTSKKSIFLKNNFDDIRANYTSPYDRFCSEEERDVLEELSESHNTDWSPIASDVFLDALSPCDTLYRAKSRKTFHRKVSAKDKKEKENQTDIERSISDNNSLRSESKFSHNNMSGSFRISLSPYQRYQIIQKVSKTPMSFESFLKRTYPVTVARTKKGTERVQDLSDGLWV